MNEQDDSNLGRADQFIDLLSQWLLRPVSSHALNIVTNGAIAIRSAIGVAREENQDVAVVVGADDTSGPLTICVVCDGMSSLPDGKKAAVAAATSFIASVFDQYVLLPLRERLATALEEANEAVLRLGQGGCTLVAMLISQQEVWAASIGDSRLYLVSEDCELKQVNHDDTLAYALNRLQERGRPQLDLQRFAKRLTHYLGMQRAVDAQYYQLSIGGDGTDTVYLLTSDGAHELGNAMLSATAVSSWAVAEMGGRGRKETPRLLVGDDDASIIVVRLQMTEQAAQPRLKSKAVSVWDAWGSFQLRRAASDKTRQSELRRTTQT